MTLSIYHRLEQNDSLTDPLKKIELFKAIASPAYIIALLEDLNEVRKGC
jgi:Transient receptor ion channel II